MTIVLTNCTNRKKGPIPLGLNSDNLDSGTVDVVAKQWIDRLVNTSGEKPARETYCGRGFREAEASAIYLSCPLYVVSAGLGIVNAESSIPTYNLTVSSGTTNSIRNKFSESSNTKVWWSRITKESPFGSSLTDTLKWHPEGIILIALSRPYIELLQDELLNLPIHVQNRLRFFGKKLNYVLPATLDGNWMPYDDRLDNAGPGYSGTQTDFAQRALRHFVTRVLVLQKDGGANTHRSLVLNSLSQLAVREIPKRQRLNDQEIGHIIRNNWLCGKGQSTTLLKIIRHDLGIACEESRFRVIYRAIKNTMGSTTT
jgi:hypothetical protein